MQSVFENAASPALTDARPRPLAPEPDASALPTSAHRRLGRAPVGGRAQRAAERRASARPPGALAHSGPAGRSRVRRAVPGATVQRAGRAAGPDARLRSGRADLDPAPRLSRARETQRSSATGTLPGRLGSSSPTGSRTPPGPRSTPRCGWRRSGPRDESGWRLSDRSCAPSARWSAATESRSPPAVPSSDSNFSATNATLPQPPPLMSRA